MTKPKLTPAEIHTRVLNIQATASDDEAAHAKEDQLYRDVLRAIANRTCTKPTQCARAALLTQKLNFGRWYA